MKPENRTVPRFEGELPGEDTIRLLIGQHGEMSAELDTMRENYTAMAKELNEAYRELEPLRLDYLSLLGQASEVLVRAEKAERENHLAWALSAERRCTDMQRRVTAMRAFIENIETCPDAPLPSRKEIARVLSQSAGADLFTEEQVREIVRGMFETYGYQAPAESRLIGWLKEIREAGK